MYCHPLLQYLGPNYGALGGVKSGFAEDNMYVSKL
jgi:hypothetical protein